MNSIRITVTPNNPSRLPGHFLDNDGLYSLDVNPNADFPISFQHDNESSDGDVTIAYNSTFIIEIPATDKNRVLLEDIGNPRIFNSKLWFERSLPGIAWVKGTDRINGVLVVTNVNYLNGKPSGYDITVIDGARFWVEAFKSLRINQLDLGDYNYSLATVFAEMQLTDPVYELGVRNVWYPAIFRGELAGTTEPEDKNKWLVEDFEPIPFLKFLLDKMFEQIGFRLVSEFFETKFFKKIGAEITENFGYDIEFTETLSAYVGYNADQIVPAANSDTLEFDNETGDFFDNGGNVTLGVYQPPVNVLVDIEIDVVSNFNPPFGGGFSPDQTLRLFVGGTVIWSHQETTDIILQQNVVLENVTVLSTQTLFLQLVNPTGEPVQIQQVSTLGITGKKFIPRGQVVSLASYVDDRLFCWPLLADVMKLFNIRQVTNMKTKTVVLEPALDYNLGRGNSGSGFYSSKQNDWASKINICRPFSQQLSEPKRYFNFKFLEDTNDKFANLTKQEGNNTSLRIHEKRFDFLDEFPALNANGEESLQLQFFASTRQINLGPGTFVPCMTENEVYNGTGQFGFFDVDSQASRTLRHVPRLLYMKGWGRKLLPTIWTFEGTEYSEYPIAYQASNFLNDEFNVAFDTVSGQFRGNRIGLFDHFHKDYLKIRNLNGLTDAFALLSELDIIELNPREELIINGDKYILKKVENWLANEPEVPTKVILLLKRLIYSY